MYFCSMKHYIIRVIGKVQGVYYRKSTQEEALRLGVKGFVKNEEDGSVYMEAEGDEGSLQKLVVWCKAGPKRAEVREVRVEEGSLQNFKEFVIKR